MVSGLSRKMNQYNNTDQLQSAPQRVMDSDPLLEQTLETFFLAPAAPVTNHEEWLLRMCSQLMHREATVVSFMEHRARQTGTNRGYRNKRDKQCLPQQQPRNSSYRASEASTSLSEETDAQHSSEL